MVLSFLCDLTILGTHVNWRSAAKHHVGLLHLCVEQNVPVAIELLYQSGADIDLMDDDGLTPLKLALQMDAVECARLLLTHNGT